MNLKGMLCNNYISYKQHNYNKHREHSPTTTTLKQKGFRSKELLIIFLAIHLSRGCVFVHVQAVPQDKSWGRTATVVL